MTIKYQKVDKRFILNAINPKIGRGKHVKTNQFSYFRVVDDYINFGITEIHIKGAKPRPDLAVINETMIDKLKEKYMFCSISAGSGKTGLNVILQRERWNQCNDCGMKLWWEDKDGSHDNDEIQLYKNKSLCKKCFRKAKGIPEYPDWCQIDTYDDMAARSTIRGLQDLFDRNPKCSQCKNDFRDHVKPDGTSKYKHLFMEKEK